MPDIDLTAVYSITETNNAKMDQINIYREEALLTVWDGNFITSYVTTAYSDTSDELNYMVNVTAVEKKTVTDEAGIETIETLTHAYVVVADKATGVCSITITTTNADASTASSSVSGTLTTTEVYN
ncbi:hypothetical protein BZG02_05535 [Labilibaculum filiforme]|uniref:Uncharacterized protein n=1 Tax=Labilibaculum filiforme TaxID=1940526 RepID=A0A2N3I1U6_9BACT|nr:hypothetical protein BZG02_05535 [Labilibaculum filiforme]